LPAKDTTRRAPWNPLLKGYPFSEKVNSISVGAETLFTRLVAQADDYGNYYGNPKQILAYLYGHRFAAGEVSATDTGRWRAELVTNTVGPLAALYTVNGSEYIHLINPRRRLRNDVSADERFPREPANIEENVISEHVTKTERERTVNGALDLDPDQEADQDQEEPSSETTSYMSKKGRKLAGDKLTWFNEFMGAFNYKRGKAAAADSWLDIKSLTRELVDEIVAGAKRECARRATLRPDQTAKMAQGWLTDRRWEDEPVETGRSRASGGADSDVYERGLKERRDKAELARKKIEGEKGGGRE